MLLIIFGLIFKKLLQFYLSYTKLNYNKLNSNSEFQKSSIKKVVFFANVCYNTDNLGLISLDLKMVL